MAKTLASVVTEFLLEDILYGEGEIDPDEDLYEAGVLDSMSFLRLIEFLEQRFGVVTDMEDMHMDRFNTVNRVVAHLRAMNATV
jgi:acyl carrier protein